MPLHAFQQMEIDEIEELAFQSSEVEIKERFKIHDLDSLNWALRKKAALDAQLKEKQDLANKELERINSWINEESQKIKQSQEFLELLIKEYAGEERKKNPKWKASTPYGKVSFRKQQAEWIVNEEEAIPYLECNEIPLIKIEKKIMKAELKKLPYGLTINDDGKVYNKLTGEEVPGIRVYERGESIFIKAGD